MSRQTALRLILGGAAIWLLLVVIVLIDDPDDALVFPLLVALAMAGFGSLSYSRHSKPWGWAALIVSALAAALIVLAVAVAGDDPGGLADGDGARLGIALYLAGAVMAAVGSRALVQSSS